MIFAIDLDDGWCHSKRLIIMVTMKSESSRIHASDVVIRVGSPKQITAHGDKFLTLLAIILH